MEREPGTATPSVAGESDTSYELARLIRVSAAASLISWFFAVVGAVGFVLAIYWAYLAFDAYGDTFTLDSFLTGFVMVAFMVLACFGSSIVMRAVSEGLMVLRDIEENTRPFAELAARPSEGSGG